jgi:hypothetical protein
MGARRIGGPRDENDAATHVDGIEVVSAPIPEHTEEDDVPTDVRLEVPEFGDVEHTDEDKTPPPRRIVETRREATPPAAPPRVAPPPPRPRPSAASTTGARKASLPPATRPDIPRPAAKSSSGHGVKIGAVAVVITMVVLAGALVVGSRSVEQAPVRGGSSTQANNAQGTLSRIFASLSSGGDKPKTAGVAEAAKAKKAGELRKHAHAPIERKRNARWPLLGFRNPGEQQRYGFERVGPHKFKRPYETSDNPPKDQQPAPMLMVFTKPPGVAVEVDGTLVGVSPVLRAIDPDKKQLVVRLSGGAYKTQTFTVQKNEEGNFQLGATMEEQLPAWVLSNRLRPPPKPPGMSRPIRRPLEKEAKKQ